MIYTYNHMLKTFSTHKKFCRTHSRILTNPVPPEGRLESGHWRIPSRTSMVLTSPEHIPDNEIIIDLPLPDNHFCDPYNDFAMYRYSEGMNLFTTGSVGIPLISEDREKIAMAYGCLDVEIYLQTWFAPEGTQCGIHNTHDFHEYHVQLMGCGRMEKFLSNDPGTRICYEEISPGSSQNQNYAIQRGGNWFYPWHQYYAVTDCLWSAIETKVVK